MTTRNLFEASGGSPAAASFIAIGDSFTEGLNDPAPDGGFRGWADRLAGMLASGYPGLRYANLAIRGKLLRQIVGEQVPAALSLLADSAPGLVSIAGGGNDLLRPGGDPDTLAELFDAGVARLRQAGCQVLIFTGFDPVAMPVLRLLRGRIAAYDMHLRAIADNRGCYLVDMWSMRFLRDMRAWSPDRLHLTPDSHHRVALRACEVLGVPVASEWRLSLADAAGTDPVADPGAVAAETPAAAVAAAAIAPLTRTSAATRGNRAAWVAARREDARWAREYMMPWINRRLHGTSSGDGLPPKRPVLQPVAPMAAM